MNAKSKNLIGYDEILQVMACLVAPLMQTQASPGYVMGYADLSDASKDAINAYRAPYQYDGALSAADAEELPPLARR